MIHFDFESASDVNLKKVGTYAYATHPSTRILCLGYAVDDEDPGIWWPGDIFPRRLKDAISGGEKCGAFNAQFENLIWINCMPDHVPTPTPQQWYCVAAQARSNGLPGKLDTVAKVLGLVEQKDMDGHRLMLKLSKGTEPKPGELERLEEYCKQDVVVERAVHQLCRPLTDDEQYVYYLNEMVNQRGIGVDREFVKHAIEYLDYANDKLNAELTELTGGEVTKLTQVQRLKDWMSEQCGYRITSLDKRVTCSLELEGPAAEALRIRQHGARSSAAKYKTLDLQTSHDDRIRGMFLFAGAGQTGRFSSLGVQLHNLVRDVLPDADQRIAAIKRLTPQQYELIYDEPIIHAMSRLVRPTLKAEDGKTFYIADWKSIEAMMTPYLAENEAEMRVWRDPKGDRYVDDYMAAFGVTDRESVTKDQRQIGKVIRLSLQFCGGPGALLAMAAGYGLAFDARTAEGIVDNWRHANPWVSQFGNAMESAALRAAGNPYQQYPVGQHITYGAQYVEDMLFLRCLLPSGRVISYADVEVKENRYGPYLTSVKPRSGTRENLWKGIFVENGVQASCADILMEKMVVSAREHWPLVAHVHDEPVWEMAERDGLEAEVKAMMETRPEWCPDFPLQAEVHTANRYTK